MSENVEKPKVKRIRKSKKIIETPTEEKEVPQDENVILSIVEPSPDKEKEEEAQITDESEHTNEITNTESESINASQAEQSIEPPSNAGGRAGGGAPASSKKGRKSKGGKIIQSTDSLGDQNKEVKPTVILHLKCFMKDLQQQQHQQGMQLDSYHFSSSSEMSYSMINANMESSHIYINNTMNANNVSNGSLVDENAYSEKDYEMKEIWKKLKHLEHSLHVNNVSDKKSACFWCTHDFDSPPIYIPKYFLKNSYHVYGCFCSPECSVAYLMNEHIDSSTRFERYHMLNHIYTKIYDYKKNIKPAPNPYYMLEKYYGNLSIQEYRALLSNERLFLVVDKPLTRIMPELHQDNEEHIINSRKVIASNTQNTKKKLQRKTQTKTNIVNEIMGQAC